jgi:hypothetical protein
MYMKKILDKEPIPSYVHVPDFHWRSFIDAVRLLVQHECITSENWKECHQLYKTYGYIWSPAIFQPNIYHILHELIPRLEELDQELNLFLIQDECVRFLHSFYQMFFMYHPYTYMDFVYKMSRKMVDSLSIDTRYYMLIDMMELYLENENMFSDKPILTDKDAKMQLNQYTKGIVQILEWFKNRFDRMIIFGYCIQTVIKYSEGYLVNPQTLQPEILKSHIQFMSTIYHRCRESLHTYYKEGLDTYAKYMKHIFVEPIQLYQSMYREYRKTYRYAFIMKPMTVDTTWMQLLTAQLNPNLHCVGPDFKRFVPPAFASNQAAYRSLIHPSNQKVGCYIGGYYVVPFVCHAHMNYMITEGTKIQLVIHKKETEEDHHIPVNNCMVFMHFPEKFEDALEYHWTIEMDGETISWYNMGMPSDLKCNFIVCA